MGEGGGILKIVLKISDEVDIRTKPRVTWCYMQVDVDLARKLKVCSIKENLWLYSELMQCQFSTVISELTRLPILLHSPHRLA